MSECNRCGAPIVWVRQRKKDGTTSQPMPIDVDDDGAILLVDDGNLRLTDRTAYGLPLVEFAPGGPGAELARSHFAACPEARKNRR